MMKGGGVQETIPMPEDTFAPSVYEEDIQEENENE